jgi:para-nitrobenzyl esterase
MFHSGRNQKQAKSQAIDRRQFFGWTAAATGAAALSHSMPLLSATPSRAAGRDPVVETAFGKVRGYATDGVYAFRGIRYGATTAGRNRFLPPQKPEPWAGIRDATSYGYSAPQTNPATRGSAAPETTMSRILAASDGFRAAPAESEDCLFLNLWTSGLGSDRKRPVMVWLHGGGYNMGTASSLMYDGTNLARRGDVVVVGLNHRLNVFGYTNFGDLGPAEYAHSGNAGQLDIIAALQWVRANIDRFGGDPKRVMIFGESGGGGKVSMLLGSPPAKGLFHSAVIESGPGVRMGERAPATRAAEMLLAELKLDAKRLPDIHTLSTDAVLSAYFKVNAAVARLRVSGAGGAFGPVLDPIDLPAHPFDPSATRVSEDVPVMIGWNKTEATVFSLGDEQLFSLDEAGMRKRIEPLAGSDSERLIQMYQREFPRLSPSGVYFYVASYSMMGAGSVAIAERKAALGKASAWLYRLDWETPVENGKLVSPHALEIPLVFGNVNRGGEGLTGGSEEAVRLGAKMSEAWVAFAATGNPNTGKSGLPQWPAYDSARRATMIFDKQSKVVNDPQKEQRLIFERSRTRD